MIYRHCSISSTAPPPPAGQPPAFHALDHNIEQSKRLRMSGIVLEKKPRPEEMAMLASSQGNDGLIRHVRDQRFYAWRFRNPLCEYRFLFMRRTGLEGYLVLQRGINNNSNSVCIVDWEATNVKVLAELLQAVIHRGGFRSISIWSTTLSNDIKKMLVNHGFYAAKEHDSLGSDVYFPPVLVKPLRATNGLLMGRRDLLDMSNWDLRAIYSDSY
jgi:hypothetical protein